MGPVAEVHNLRLKFPGAEGLQLKDVSLAIEGGQFMLLLGPSGCGKSTLLQVLTGLIPDSVEVPMKADLLKTPESWGFVFQDPDTQFCMPYADEEIAFVLENMQIPRSEMPERIRYYLETVGLHLSDPHTPISQLSQGMKQRLAIASVLALEPEVLFLDEPTALLDPEGTEQVWETLKSLKHIKTMVVVEHKIELVAGIADRVVMLDNAGNVIADGTKDHVFEHFKRQLIEYGIWYPGVWEDRWSEARGTLNEAPASPMAPAMTENAQPAIALRNFQAYRGKEMKLDIGHASVYGGDWIAVVGSNGAGKSTLLLALMQLLRTAGEYAVFGRPAGSIRNISEEIAYVFQNPEFQFIENSVYDEIAYSLVNEGVPAEQIKGIVEPLLQFFQLQEKSRQHPYQLSLGQKRRLSVASSIVRDPSILLLDEPTFGQDARNTFAMLEKFDAWRKQGKTILMVTHDTNIVRLFATRVWRIEKGCLVFDGTPEQFCKVQPCRERSEPNEFVVSAY